MAFTESWVETDPDGSIITVSQLDDHVRTAKRALRERMEGDPAVLGSGVFDSGTFGTTAMVKKGVARAFTITNADQTTTYLQDGRLAVNLDTNVLYHSRASGLTGVKVLGNAVVGPIISNDGSVGAPAFAFTSSPTSGLYRGSSGDVVITVLGALAGYFGPSLQLFMKPGTAPLPAFSFDGDENTGMYRLAADILAFATGGVAAWQIDSAGTLKPAVDGVPSIGAGTFRVNALFLSGDINFGVNFKASGNMSIATGGTERAQIGDFGIRSKVQGSEAAPAFAFVDDTDVGIWRVANDSLGLATGGANRFTIDDNGRMRCITPGSAALPCYVFQDNTGSGMYLQAGAELAFSCGGVKKADISTGGNDSTVLVMECHRGAAVTIDRILVGAINTAGAGFRALCISN